MSSVPQGSQPPDMEPPAGGFGGATPGVYPAPSAYHLAADASVPDGGDCVEASRALKYGIVGFFSFAFVFGPLAIVKALAAKRILAANPRLRGEIKADVALVLGVLQVVLCLVMLAVFAMSGD